MTGYKTILCAARHPASAQKLFALAFQLASASGAHVTGLFAAQPIRIHPALRGRQLQDWIDRELEQRARDIAEVQQAYMHQAQLAGAHADWRHEDAVSVPEPGRVLAIARCADLVMLDRLGTGQDFMEPDLLLEDLLLSSGRPVLLVPKGFSGDDFGNRALIAWNGSRESTRAVFDALPILRMAAPDGVRIVGPEEKPGSGVLPAGTALAEALGRHGIKAEVGGLDRHPIDAGGDILGHARDFNASLIVMGAWGHSRLREFVFGGATDTALRESTMPLLMSH